MLRISTHIQKIRHLLKNSHVFELSGEVVQRLRWLLFAAEHSDNVSLTCRHFGISRTTFLRWKGRFDPNDPRSLVEQSRRPHTLRAAETDVRTIALIGALRREQPLISKQDIQKILHLREGIDLSPSTVGRVITRLGFFFADTPAHRRKRAEIEDRHLHALEESHPPPHPHRSVPEPMRDPQDIPLLTHTRLAS